jgi:RNA polymerase sigma factor (sigma-70 family)
VGDGELIDRLRRREQSGLEELSRRYGPLMRYILSPILPDEQDREECLADVVLLVWERVDAYSPDRGAFSTWLTALTRNAAISRARKRRQDTEPLSPERASPAPGPEEQVLRRELLEDLRRALSSLSRRDQILFHRKYYYLQPTAQIAAEMGMTERAVEGRLYRLKKRLRKELGGAYCE